MMMVLGIVMLPPLVGALLSTCPGPGNGVALCSRFTVFKDPEDIKRTPLAEVDLKSWEKNSISEAVYTYDSGGAASSQKKV